MSQPNQCSKLLPSDEFYNKLNEELRSTLFYTHFCENIGSLKSDSRYIELCYKVVQYLIVNADDNDKKISCNHCKLLNYWIFDQIKRINREYKTNINVAYGHISYVTNIIMQKYYKFSESTCFLDSDVPFDEYRDAKKEFYEYCLDYKEINEKNHLTDTGCDTYNDYLKKKSHLLANFKHILSGNKLQKCPNADGETGGCNPNVLLDELSKINDISETKIDIPDDSSKLFLGLSKKNTATAASVAGVSLLGLTLFKVKIIFIYQFEYQIGLLILCYH
ncbi:VIR protein [Plasmodium vivax]|uniref:VIR protein n=1 Tax=Plasmodium vivax TaxID=5855 RepID=A0A1G4EDQ5_PLAVI|nr:VIR protein [Plasmodium vivax]